MLVQSSKVHQSVVLYSQLMDKGRRVEAMPPLALGRGHPLHPSLPLAKAPHIAPSGYKRDWRI